MNKIYPYIWFLIGIGGLVMLKSVLIDDKYYHFVEGEDKTKAIIGNTLLFAFIGSAILAGIAGVAILKEK